MMSIYICIHSSDNHQNFQIPSILHSRKNNPWNKMKQFMLATLEGEGKLTKER